LQFRKLACPLDISAGNAQINGRFNGAGRLFELTVLRINRRDLELELSGILEKLGFFEFFQGGDVGFWSKTDSTSSLQDETGVKL